MWTNRAWVAANVTLDRWELMRILELVLKGAQFQEVEVELGATTMTKEIEDWQRIKAQAVEKGNTVVIAEADKTLATLGYVAPVEPEPPTEAELVKEIAAVEAEVKL